MYGCLKTFRSQVHWVVRGNAPVLWGKYLDPLAKANEVRDLARHESLALPCGNQEGMLTSQVEGLLKKCPDAIPEDNFCLQQGTVTPAKAVALLLGAGYFCPAQGVLRAPMCSLYTFL